MDKRSKDKSKKERLLFKNDKDLKKYLYDMFGEEEGKELFEKIVKMGRVGIGNITRGRLERKYGERLVPFLLHVMRTNFDLFTKKPSVSLKTLKFNYITFASNVIKYLGRYRNSSDVVETLILLTRSPVLLSDALDALRDVDWTMINKHVRETMDKRIEKLTAEVAERNQFRLYHTLIEIILQRYFGEAKLSAPEDLNFVRDRYAYYLSLVENRVVSLGDMPSKCHLLLQMVKAYGKMGIYNKTVDWLVESAKYLREMPIYHVKEYFGLLSEYMRYFPKDAFDHVHKELFLTLNKDLGEWQKASGSEKRDITMRMKLILYYMSLHLDRIRRFLGHVKGNVRVTERGIWNEDEYYASIIVSAAIERAPKDVQSYAETLIREIKLPVVREVLNQEILVMTYKEVEAEHKKINLKNIRRVLKAAERFNDLLFNETLDEINYALLERLRISYTQTKHKLIDIKHKKILKTVLQYLSAHTEELERLFERKGNERVKIGEENVQMEDYYATLITDIALDRKMNRSTREMAMKLLTSMPRTEFVTRVSDYLSHIAELYKEKSYEKPVFEDKRGIEFLLSGLTTSPNTKEVEPSVLAFAGLVMGPDPTPLRNKNNRKIILLTEYVLGSIGSEESIKLLLWEYAEPLSTRTSSVAGSLLLQMTKENPVTVKNAVDRFYNELDRLTKEGYSKEQVLIMKERIGNIKSRIDEEYHKLKGGVTGRERKGKEKTTKGKKKVIHF